MSNTHAHVHPLLHVLDPTVSVEVHDHRHGPCDLPTRTSWLAHAQATSWFDVWRTYACQYRTLWWAIPPVCSCNHCFGNDATGDRRRTRRTVNQTLTAAVRATDPAHVVDLLDDAHLT